MRARSSWAVLGGAVSLLVLLACGTTSSTSGGGGNTDASISADGSANPPGCPASVPTGVCTVDKLSCNYNDGCNTTNATCASGRWELASTARYCPTCAELGGTCNCGCGAGKKALSSAANACPNDPNSDRCQSQCCVPDLDAGSDARDASSGG